MIVEGGGAYDVVRVQVASLEEYAASLQHHISGLQEARGDFKASPAFGGAGFVEASGVLDRHTEVFTQMQGLLQNVRDVITASKQALADNATKLFRRRRLRPRAGQRGCEPARRGGEVVVLPAEGSSGFDQSQPCSAQGDAGRGGPGVGGGERPAVA
jgi:hypothetical protein